MRDDRRLQVALLRDGQEAAQGLVSWLENTGKDDAAAGRREGLEETLTVLKLGHH